MMFAKKSSLDGYAIKDVDVSELRCDASDINDQSQVSLLSKKVEASDFVAGDSKIKGFLMNQMQA